MTARGEAAQAEPLLGLPGGVPEARRPKAIALRDHGPQGVDEDAGASASALQPGGGAVRGGQRGLQRLAPWRFRLSNGWRWAETAPKRPSFERF